MVATLCFAACGADDTDNREEASGVPATNQDLEAHEWVLVPAESTPTIIGERRVTLDLAGDVASGTAPCNTYRGSFSRQQDTEDGLAIRDIVTTRRGCERELMEAEAAYVEALGAVDHGLIDGGEQPRLVLVGGGVRLVFTSYDAQQLLLGDWQIVNVATADALASVLGGTEPVIRFDRDGTAVVEGGCNTMRTTWALDGPQLTFEGPAATRMQCDEPPGVMDQEAALVSALTASASAQIAPDSLTLLNGEGRIVVVAVRQSARSR